MLYFINYDRHFYTGVVSGPANGKVKLNVGKIFSETRKGKRRLQINFAYKMSNCLN